MNARTLIILLSLLTAARSLAQVPEAVMPPQRVMHQFDFEERQLGNDEDVPMHWSKLEGPGLPHYLNGRLTTDTRHAGNYAFRIDLDGGSCIYRYEAGKLLVKTGAHYRVRGFCKTTPLPNARARLSACFADIDGRLIESTRCFSRLLASDADADWTPLAVEMTAVDPAAVSIVLEMQLVQPSLYIQSADQPTVPLQDIHGTAWFDDISVCQIPQLSVSTGRAANVFAIGDQPELILTLNDRSVVDLNAQVLLRNARGIEVFRRTTSLAAAAAESIGPSQVRLSIELPSLHTGWYDATVILNCGDVEVAHQHASLVQLADDGSTRSIDRRFGVDATNIPTAAWPQLPPSLGSLGVGRVKLAVGGGVQNDMLDHLLDQLHLQEVATTACLIGPPTRGDMADQAKDWSMAGRVTDWRPALDDLIARQATRIDRWQLGRDGWDGFAADPSLRRVYEQVYQQFSALMEQPDLALPWPAWSEIEGQYPRSPALFIPTSILPNQIPLYLQAGASGHRPGSISVVPLDRDTYGRDAQLADYAERFIQCLAARSPSIDVPAPFGVRTDDDSGRIEPTELFLITRTLTQLLGRSTYRGTVPVGDDIEAHLFDRNGQGVLALWSHGAEASVHKLSINLGIRPIRVDLWGERTPLLRADPAKSQDTQLDVGPMPIFLVDIDAEIARLRSSVGFDQPLIESSFEPHTRHFRFVNPYPQAITGMLRFKAPPGWTLNPPSINFNINSGDTFDREVTIEFPYNSLAGTKTVGVQFSLQADRNNAFTVPSKLTLGLSDVGTQSMAYRDGDDAVVQQIISNYGEKPVNYTAFATFPGHMRLERLVTDLPPGKTTIKRYRIHDRTLAAGTKIRLGLKEVEGSRVLNESVELR